MFSFLAFLTPYFSSCCFCSPSIPRSTLVLPLDIAPWSLDLLHRSSQYAIGTFFSFPDPPGRTVSLIIFFSLYACKNDHGSICCVILQPSLRIYRGRICCSSFPYTHLIQPHDSELATSNHTTSSTYPPDVTLNQPIQTMLAKNCIIAACLVSTVMAQAANSIFCQARYITNVATCVIGVKECNVVERFSSCVCSNTGNKP